MQASRFIALMVLICGYMVASCSKVTEQKIQYVGVVLEGREFPVQDKMAEIIPLALTSNDVEIVLQAYRWMEVIYGPEHFVSLKLAERFKDSAPPAYAYFAHKIDGKQAGIVQNEEWQRQNKALWHSFVQWQLDNQIKIFPEVSWEEHEVLLKELLVRSDSDKETGTYSLKAWQ